MIRPSGRRILIATLGSLGDLHPYLAIAKELKRRGHRPVIATLDRYRAAVEGEGAEFGLIRPLESQLGDPRQVVREILHSRNGPEYLIRRIVMRYVRESYEDLDRLAKDADLLVSHPMTVALPMVAEKRGLPWASTVLSPMSLFSASDPSILPAARWLFSLRRLGAGFYRGIWGLAKIRTRSWERPLRNLRAEIGLPPSNKPALFEGQFSPRLNLALFSRLFAKSQPDWPANTEVCGFARYDGRPTPGGEASGLRAFLESGEAPIVFTLGSSVSMDPGDFFSMARAATRRLGRRAVLITGDSSPDDSDSTDDVKVLNYLPYSEVFPHASVIVHPGGIGTLSQALAAGRPMLVTPAAFDQPDNAHRAFQLGVARILPFRRVAAKSLAGNLEEILRRPGYRLAGTRLGRAILAENGASCACDFLEKI